MSNKTYQIVRQHNGDKDYYTIFDLDDKQYCDDDGNPIRYDSYDDAKFECDMLNDEFDHWQNKIEEQMERR